MKTIFVMFKTARQLDGEYVFVSAEKAFLSQEEAEDQWRKQVRSWRETVGGVECEIERGIHEIELQE